jgi:putative peptidoglycan lipid II flippase
VLFSGAVSSLRGKIRRRTATATGDGRVLHWAALIAVLSLVVRAIGLVREMAIAASFGTSDEVDAYLTAFLLPNFVATVLAGSLNAAFIPTFIAVRESQGKPAADRLLAGVLGCTLVLLGVVTLVLVACAGPLLSALAPGYSEEKAALALRLFYWLAPTMALQGVISLWSAVLNAGERFALAALLPALATLVAFLFLLLCGRTLGIYSLSVGFLVGFATQALVLGFKLRQAGHSTALALGGWSPELKVVLHQYLPMIAGAFMISGTGLVEQFMAARLESGSVASLGFASRITGVANTICATALGTAVLPHFSNLVAKADWAGLHGTLRNYRWLIFGVGGAAGLLLALASEPVVTLLFQRGNFSTEDVAVVAGLQRCYALQLPFYAGGIFLVRLISALKANKFLMWGSVISLLVNLSLNLLLVERMGLRGVALSNSLMYMLSFAYLSAVVAHLLRTRLVKAKPVSCA